MVALMTAGKIPTAAELNDIAQVGAILADVTATSDSSTWNSATKVLTNLVASFSAINGSKYEALAVVTFSCAGASNQEALGLVWKAGTVGPTDTLFGASGPRTHPDATGFNVCTVYGIFTAASTATHEVGVIGWKPTGNTGVSKLEGDAAFAINRLTVKRVA